MVEKAEIKETDKPFILALVSSAIAILNILIVAVGSALGNELMAEKGIEMLKFTFPLSSMAWGFYFSTNER